MNELSIEEKAKHYDEAIERANSLLSSNELGNAWIYKLLPELKESEDERIRKELIEFVKSRGGFKQEYIAYLEKQCEQNTVLGEEDEEILDDIIVDVEVLQEQDRTKDGKAAYQKEINFLKSLKERVQPQQELSKEDYNAIETIACHLDNTDNEGLAEVLRNIRNKYYHIIPQSQWKPSDEQMRELSIVATGKGWFSKEILSELLEQLKKLRDE